MVTKALTLQEAREWGLEAARTSLRLNVITGPKSFGNNWPPYIQDWLSRNGKKVSWSDYDIQNIKPIRVPPSARQIERMDRGDAVMSTQLNENERTELHPYLGSRTTKRLSVATYCRKNDIKTHVFKRRIDKYFQRIATNATFNPRMNKKTTVANVENTGIPEVECDTPLPKGVWHSEIQTSPDHMGTKLEQRARLETALLKRRQNRDREKSRATALK